MDIITRDNCNDAFEMHRLSYHYEPLFHFSSLLVIMVLPSYTRIVRQKHDTQQEVQSVSRLNMLHSISQFPNGFRDASSVIDGIKKFNCRG